MKILETVSATIKCATDKIRNYKLLIGNIEVLPTELEVYYYKSGEFEDKSVHRNELQQSNINKLYIHRFGKDKNSKFVGGTRGGIDICLSDEKGLYYTFLIRSIVVNGKPIVGPNNVLCELRGLLGTEEEIESLECIWVINNEPCDAVFCSSRIGLTTSDNCDYNCLPLRFVRCDNYFKSSKFKNKEKLMLEYLSCNTPSEGKVEFCKKHMGYCISKVKEMK